MLIGTGNPYSEGGRSHKAAFTAKGGTIAGGSESYGTADADFSAQLTKIKENESDVVFVPDYVQQLDQFFKSQRNGYYRKICWS